MKPQIATGTPVRIVLRTDEVNREVRGFAIDQTVLTFLKITKNGQAYLKHPNGRYYTTSPKNIEP